MLKGIKKFGLVCIFIIEIFRSDVVIPTKRFRECTESEIKFSKVQSVKFLLFSGPAQFRVF